MDETANVMDAPGLDDLFTCEGDSDESTEMEEEEEEIIIVGRCVGGRLIEEKKRSTGIMWEQPPAKKAVWDSAVSGAEMQHEMERLRRRLEIEEEKNRKMEEQRVAALAAAAQATDRAARAEAKQYATESTLADTVCALKQLKEREKKRGEDRSIKQEVMSEKEILVAENSSLKRSLSVKKAENAKRPEGARDELVISNELDTKQFEMRAEIEELRRGKEAAKTAMGEMETAMGEMETQISVLRAEKRLEAERSAAFERDCAGSSGSPAHDAVAAAAAAEAAAVAKALKEENTILRDEVNRLKDGMRHWKSESEQKAREIAEMLKKLKRTDCASKKG